MFVVLWMLLATTSFTLMAFIVKIQSKQFNVIDILFVRSASSVGFVLLIWLFLKFQIKTNVFAIHARRSIFGIVSMSTWYYTLGVLPMGVSVTLNYLSPLFFGIILFKFDQTCERPSIKELMYVVVGFLGVAMLMNPLSGTFSEHDVFPIILGTSAAAIAAFAFRDVKILKNSGQNEWQMVFYFSIVATFLSLPFTSFVKKIDGHSESGLILLMLAGVFGALGQLGVSKAFGSGDQIKAASLQYLSVVFSVLLSWMALGEELSTYQGAGILIIICAAILTILERDRQMNINELKR